MVQKKKKRKGRKGFDFDFDFYYHNRVVLNKSSRLLKNWEINNGEGSKGENFIFLDLKFLSNLFKNTIFN